jgi:hypothetical protein
MCLAQDHRAGDEEIILLNLLTYSATSIGFFVFFPNVDPTLTLAERLSGWQALK